MEVRKEEGKEGRKEGKKEGRKEGWKEFNVKGIQREPVHSSMKHKYFPM